MWLLVVYTVVSNSIAAGSTACIARSTYLVIGANAHITAPLLPNWPTERYPQRGIDRSSASPTLPPAMHKVGAVMPSALTSKQTPSIGNVHWCHTASSMASPLVESSGNITAATAQTNRHVLAVAIPERGRHRVINDASTVARSPTLHRIVPPIILARLTHRHGMT